MELDDLVYSYPDITDPNFQAKLSLKLEFLELASSIKEITPERGEAYKHQELIRRAMIVLDRLLMMHEIGTGKSCAIFKASDLFSPDFVEKYKPPTEITPLAAALVDYVTIYIQPRRTHIRKVIILTNGKTLANNLKQQFVCVCSYKYESERVKKAESKRQQKSAVTASLKPFYEFHTYRTFYKTIRDASTITRNEAGAITKITIPPRLIELYSNTMFVLEEAHNLRTEAGMADRQLQEELELSLEPEELEKEDKLKLSNKAEAYVIYSNLFDVIRKSKIIAMTATPAVDGPDEIRGIINLLRPAGQKMPAVPFNEYTDAELEEVARKYFSGYVSYVRALDSGVNIDYQGETLYTEDGSPLKTKILPLSMRLFQESAYLRSTEISAETKTQAARIGEKQASTFVAPNGQYQFSKMRKFIKTTPAIREVIEGKSKLIRPAITQATPEFSEMLREDSPEYPGLADMSAKYDFLLDLADSTFDQPGLGYAFFEFVGTGADMAGESFQANGWEKFNSKQSIFRYASGIEAKRSYCEIKDQNRSVDIPEAKRFAVFTGSIDPFYILEALNSPENINVNGRYLKWIFASPVSAEGVSFKNVTNIVLVNGAWNMTGNLQRTGRAIRSGGWDSLIKSLERAFRENPEINVKIYQLATYTQEKYNQFKFSGRFEAPPLQREGVATRGAAMYSIDAASYAEAERKDRSIQRVMKYLKWSSIDCIIHRIRNQRTADLPGSSVCHYLEDCEYGCMDDQYLLNLAEKENAGNLDQFIKDSVDLSSYLLLYSDKIVNRVVDIMINLLHVRSEFSVSDLIDLVADLLSTDPEYNQKLGMYLSQTRIHSVSAKLVDLAIEKIINQHLTVVDRFGFVNYVVEDQSLIKLSSDLPTVTAARFDQVPLSGYASKLIANETTTTAEYTETVRRSGPSADDEITKLGQSLVGLSETRKFETVIEYLNRLDHQTQNDVLEQCINSSTEICQLILRRYRSFLYPDVPVLCESFLSDDKPGGKIGDRIKLNTETLIRLTDPNVISTPGARIVVINTFPSYGIVVGGEKAGKRGQAKFNKLSSYYNPRYMRLFDGTEWRDMTDAELWGYNQVIQALVMRYFIGFASKGRFMAIYTYDDSQLSIRDNSLGATEISDNSKRMSRGKAWSSYTIPWLAYIAGNLNVDISDLAERSPHRNAIIEAWNDVPPNARSILQSPDIMEDSVLRSAVASMSDYEIRYLYVFSESGSYRGIKKTFELPIKLAAERNNRILFI